MYPRKPFPYAEQILRMRACLRRLQTQLKHRYAEFFEATKGRRECALEVALRHRLLEATRDAVALGEACLEELRRQEAMFYARFKPGDRVVVDYEEKGVVRTDGPYLITEVRPDKGTRFHYRAFPLTKKGAIHKRTYEHWLSPARFSAMRLTEVAADDEGEWEARYYRECAQTARILAFEKAT